MSNRLVILNTVGGSQIAVHPDRMFGVDSPLTVGEETHECVVALRMIEPDRIALVAVKDSFSEVAYNWGRALELAATQRAR